jgi:hypothetical protein
MAVQLTPAQAEAKIKQIEDARDRAVRRPSSTTAHHAGRKLAGRQCIKYGSTADQQNDEFHGIIQKLNNIVELGSHHMRSVSSPTETAKEYLR